MRITTSQEKEGSYSLMIQGKWEGNANLTADGNTHFRVHTGRGIDTIEGWSGNLIAENGNVGTGMDSGRWNGDMYVTQTKSDIETSGNIFAMRPDSAWVGNAYLKDGASFNGQFHSGSSWDGSVEIKNVNGINTLGEQNQILSYSETEWNGDFTYENTSERQLAATNSINIGYSAVWNGDFTSSNFSEATDSTINAIRLDYDSHWKGNAEISGNQRLDVALDHSDWTGNLDLSQNSTGGESAGQLNLEQSIWRGHLSGSDHGLNIQMNQESEWHITGDSMVENLELANDSKLYFANPQNRSIIPFHTVTIKGNYDAGAGSEIYMRTDLANQIGDLMDIQGSVNGQSVVSVNNQGSASVDPSKELTVIKTGSSESDAFTLANEVEVGGFTYMMKQSGTNWILYSNDRLPFTSTASSGINSLSGTYLLNYGETDTLVKRMGELREGQDERNIWGRVYGGGFHSVGTDRVSGYDLNYAGVQVGADKKYVLRNNRGAIYVGGMFGYSSGHLDYGNGSGALTLKTVGVYATYHNSNDFYANFILKHGWTKGSFNVQDTAGDWVNGENLKNSGFTGSLEVGQKIVVNPNRKEGWYLEPQAQLTIGNQQGNSITASNGLKIDLDGYQSLQGRLGVRAGYEVKAGENPVNVYGKVSYVHEFDGKIDASLNGIDVQEDFGSSWWNYGIGVTAKVGTHHNLYLEVEKSSGNRFDQKWGVSGGYRLSW